MPGPRMKTDGRRAKAPKKTLRRLLSYMGAYKFHLLLVLVCIVISAGANVARSKSVEYIVADYIDPMLRQQTPDFRPLLGFLGVMALIYLAGVASSYLFNLRMAIVAQKVQKTIRDQMFEKMQRLPIRYFDTHTHGDIMSYYTNDIDTLRQMISQSLPQTFSSAVSIVVVIAAMLATSPILTLISLLCIGLLMMVVRRVAGHSGRYFVGQQKSLGVVNGYIEEMISGQRVIKVFCHEEAARQGFDVRNGELCKNAYLAHKYANILMPVMGNLGYIQYAILAIAGGYMAIAGLGGLTIAKLMSFLLLSRSLNMPISQVSNQFNSVIMALAGAERIFALMDEEPEQDQGYVTLVNARRDPATGEITECAERTGLWAWKHPHKAEGTVTYTPLQGDITMTDVDFGYSPDKVVLHDISLYARPGQKVAFVGATGAGKTTITNLLNRFYDIADGKIRYDGININKICKPDLRRSLGMVLQDTNLFTGTVMENIRYGNLDATDEQCIRAAKLANAHDFIMRLPEGYNTPLSGNGGNLSQGQRQLLSIARAAVADPPVMILDEATSSIDTRTEALVQRGMDALMEGRTVFVIAHRLSTIRNADCIMVLDHGRIIERGTHTELLEKRGTYYRLYTGAFELE